jgi:sigma-B regulation protein RsbU (phosphoserine phosphatase)
MNVLRSQTLPNVDFSQPDQVLAGVNQAFPMEEHDDRFFTIWYGVFNRRTRSLCYASGGHHATLMLHGDAPDLAELTASGLPIGVMPESVYPCAETQVPPGAKLYVFSDGVFEIARPDGSMWTYEEFCEMLCGLRTTESAVEAVLETVREIRGGDVFDDDFSLLEIVCP